MANAPDEPTPDDAGEPGEPAAAGDPVPPAPQPLGGVFHTYLGYDAVKFGSAQPADPGGAARGAFEHLLAMGSMRRFTDEELARSILQQAQGKNFALREFVHALVASKEFRLK